MGVGAVSNCQLFRRAPAHDAACDSWYQVLHECTSTNTNIISSPVSGGDELSSKSCDSVRVGVRV